ncbi:marine proteobacterial sortase target protein [Kordiimonas sp. SCSIO 12603]|uniref:marine proteobacterial sortase target protein n=1 Tax=Kordiimonas sp. SCSIO 12603 TaxID=2829596 RepID=UPI002102B107|nr:marine proteobacterial sortase target protein [Kordiimonas sp. SCSIO 12603]UTW59910.1 marine proteobacterial sortase target protein [Kordiimonas sp. SCSIO 12603]
MLRFSQPLLYAYTAAALAFGLVLNTRPALADETSPPTASSDQKQLRSWQEGGFEIKSIPHEGMPQLWLDALQLSSEVKTEINGFIAYTTVKQSFRNTTDQWVNGTYRFPLPDTAAIDAFEMLVGEKRIKGKIKEKQEAKRIYEQAVKEGKKAALLSQIRPNMFSSKVGNVAPGAVITVEISFITHAEQNGLTFSWKLPQAITPRYHRLEDMVPTPEPKSALATHHQKHGIYRHPQNAGNLAVFDIFLAPGAAVQKLTSPSHDIRIAEQENRYHITLRADTEPADRDFILRWEYKPAGKPKPLFIKEETESGTYVLGIVIPPKKEESLQKSPPRDIQFIIDVSGSMHGHSIVQAKRALLEAVDRLRTEDRFDIIKFNNDYSRLFGATQQATAENVNRARNYILGLEADGGTEMMPALVNALDLNQTAPADEKSLPQIMFLTDGAIGYEEAMFKLVEEKLGTTRLFTVGVGNAPNGWFMRKAAEFGRGIHTQIDNPLEAEKTLEELFSNMAAPSVQKLTLSGNGMFEAYPTRLPDLYGNRPTVFVVKTDDSKIRLEGESVNSKRWKISERLKRMENGKGISKLWARKKVEAISDAALRGLPQEEAKAQILKTALTHQIVSKYTSFVAVEEKISRPQGTSAQDSIVPENLPKGMKLRRVSAPQMMAQSNFSGPQTATMKDLKLITGFILLLFATELILWLRREARREA